MTWKRARQKLHLILIRDAEKPVKRARISRFLLHAALVQSCLLIAAVVIWQYTLHQLSSEQISELSSRLSHTRSEYTEIVRSKESTIDNLQLEIVEMTRRTDDLRQQMEKLKKLEGEIRELLREVESPDLAAQSGTTAIASGADQSGGNVGGQAHPVTNEQWNQFLRETEDSFDRLHTEMQHLNRRLENARADLSAAVDALRRTPDHWPTDSNTVTSGYGIRKDPFTGNLTFHQGMDIGGKLNDPVYAAADGTVAARGWDASRGYYVRIRHDDETQTVYMHLGKIAVKVNEDVKKGEKIASMGSTGRSTGPHLHFEIWKNGQPVNPVEYVGDRHP